MWKGVNWSLSIQGPRITLQDMHIDALWLLRHETHGKAGLKGGSGLDIRSCSGLRTDCTTHGGFCLLQMWVDALKSRWRWLGNSQTQQTASFKWREAGGLFYHRSARLGPELTAMSQRKLTRQLRLWESPEGPPPAPSLTSPVSPVDHPRGHGGSALFRRLKLNRSIQERRRSCHCVCRYGGFHPSHWSMIWTSSHLFSSKDEAAATCDCSASVQVTCENFKHSCKCFLPEEHFKLIYSMHITLFRSIRFGEVPNSKCWRLIITLKAEKIKTKTWISTCSLQRIPLAEISDVFFYHWENLFNDNLNCTSTHKAFWGRGVAPNWPI